MSLVPKTRTIVTLDALYEPIVRAFTARGVAIEPVDVAIVYGKLVAECGHPGPGQCCWNWNVGNNRGRSAAGNWTQLVGAYEFRRTGLPLLAGEREIATPAGAAQPPGTYCYLPAPERQEFRAYVSLEEACDEYTSILGTRFPDVWRELTRDESDAARFVDAMRADRYFTGDATAYARNVVALARESLPRVPRIAWDASSGSTGAHVDVAGAHVDVAGAHVDVATLDALSALYEGPATAIRASEGEHTVRLDDVEF